MRTTLSVTVLAMLTVLSLPRGVHAEIPLPFPPSVPGAAIQFQPCFQTDEQRQTAVKAIRKALRDPATKESPDVRTSCSDDFWLNGRETLGVWLAPLPKAGLLGRDALRLLVDDARQRGLAQVSLVGNREDFGWSVSAEFIDTLRARLWAALPKRMNDAGEPDTDGSVHLSTLSVQLIEPDTIRTEVTGFYDVGPNADFRLRVTDVITNVEGKLQLETDTSLTIDTSAYEWLAGLFTVVLPPLGLHLFDAIDQSLMHLATPDGGQSLGALIVQFAPNQVMIDAGQKVTFLHTRFLVDKTGVTGGGRVRLEAREPSVTIEGPRSPIVDSRTVVLSYTAVPFDLRATADEPLVVQWSLDGEQVADGSLAADIMFRIPGNVRPGDVSEHRLNVRITDADDLSAERTVTVRLQYEPGGPPVCRRKPWLPQCGPGGIAR